MSNEPHSFQPMFHIDVSPSSESSNGQSGFDKNDLIIALLRQLLVSNERQNKLLENLVQQTSAAQKQRAADIGQWKEANPHLAEDCRMAAETLGRVQNEFLRNLTDEVLGNEESLLDGEFMLNEFVDRFGPRMAHLNGVLQVLSQLGVAANQSSNAAP